MTYVTFCIIRMCCQEPVAGMAMGERENRAHEEVKNKEQQVLFPMYGS